MKIALIGYGKMGHEIEKAAIERGHEIVSTIDPQNPAAKFKEITKESLNSADVCVDFTHPDSLIGNIEKASKLGVNMVVGTTGWYARMDEVKKIVSNGKIGFIWASNFSIGVNMFYKMIEGAAKIINKVDAYDIGGYELHHNQKADSPSGTAKSIAEILKKNIARKKNIVYDKIDRRIGADEIHFASVRCGSIPGTHAVVFDSAADTIEMRHTARSRAGFALGAVMAAEFIKGKKGFFEINDLMNNIIGGDKNGV